MRHPANVITSVLFSLSSALATSPLPVTDLQIQVADSAHLQLNWSPVYHDTEGQPLPCVYHDIHRGSTPDFTLGEASLLDSTSASQFIHSLAGELGFYRIQVQSCDDSYPRDLVRIPAGQFIMGQANVATPEHTVTLTHDFLLGRTEVTNAQFLEALNWAKAQGLVSVVGDFVKQYDVNLLRLNDSVFDYLEIRYNPGTQQFYLHAGTYDGGSTGPGEAYPEGYDPANHPVKHVSWYGAACYCDWRSLMENLPPYYCGQ
jgi:formylglycine-generating enzyme required for sulfatase activity